MTYYLAAAAAMLMWSSSFIATKIAYQSFSPLVLCFVRFALACVLMTIYRLFTGRKETIRPGDRRNVFLSAILGISIYYALENIGVAHTSASSASLIEASFPALTALVGLLVYHERSSRRMLAGIAISILGVVILTDFNDGAGSFFGDFLLFIDGIFWGFYNYLVQSAADHYDSFTLSYYQILTGTVFFIPMVLIEHAPAVSVTPSVILAVLYLSAGCSITALLLYNYALKGLSSTAASAILNLMPVFGVLLSVLILHETVTLHQILGGIVILAGILISTLR